MTDLEMTKLAAKAYGLDVSMLFEDNRGKLCGPLGTSYDPLTDAAQAFELLDALYMRIIEADRHEIVLLKLRDNTVIVSGDADLKRAIVECAANYQLEKEKQA